MGKSSPVSNTAQPSSPTKPASPLSSAKAAHRRRFQTHLQAWAYDHFKRNTFKGWITPAPESTAFALAKPVLCHLRTANTPGTTKVHLKLFRRQGRRGGAEAGVYDALVRVGGGWVSDQEFFAALVGDRLRNSDLRAASVIMNLRSGPKVVANAACSSSTAAPIASRDWVSLDEPFKLMQLPKDVRLMIFERVLEKPSEFIFDGIRSSPRGRHLCQYYTQHQNFLSLSCTSRQIADHVNYWFYSTSKFSFQSRRAFVQFLHSIGRRNRPFLRQLCIQFNYEDYLDIFTPRHIIMMMDTPVWHRDRLFLRDTFAELAESLAKLTIRMRDPDTLDAAATPVESLTLEIPWIIMSALRTKVDLALRADFAFEASHWPHRDLWRHCGTSLTCWDSLMYVLSFSLLRGLR